jgi:hypothetical protein
MINNRFNVVYHLLWLVKLLIKRHMKKSKLDKLHDFLLYNVLLLWPVWFLLIYIIGNIIIHGF